MKNRYRIFNNRTKVESSNFYICFGLYCIILGINSCPLLEKHSFGKLAMQSWNIAVSRLKCTAQTYSLYQKRTVFKAKFFD